MDGAPQDRLADAFERALKLPAGERVAFLRAECGADEPLRRELTSLLAAYDASTGWFEALAERVVLPATAALNDDVDAHAAVGAPDRYELLERVGAGGMGVVYKARDLRLGRVVALKFLPAGLADDDDARARLITEARAASALDHPHIGVVHDVGETAAGRPFIAMAWYEGETLQDRLARGPLPVDDACALVLQVAHALAAAHDAGVIHRDVKPSNILLTRDGSARLVDFGIAKFAWGGEATREGATRGTVAYMSPEQAAGPGVDTRTDVWSLGVVLYEALAGRRPFVADNELALLHAIRTDTPPPLVTLRPDVPAGVARVVELCLTKDPALRYGTVALLAEDLAQGGAHGVKPHASAARRKRPLRGRAAPIGAAAAAAFLAGAWLNAQRAGDAGIDERRVVVATFENRTGDAALDAVGGMAADWITQGLVQTGLVEVVPLSTSLAASRHIAALAPSHDSAERLRLLARESGAAIVVSGAYYRQGDSIYIRATVTDALRERLLHALPPLGAPAAQPLAAVEPLRARLLDVLAPHLFPERGYSAIVTRPPAFEAYQAFMQGLQLFLDASARDSSFTLPLVHAGVALSLLGRFAELDALLAGVRPRLHELDDVERLAFEMLDARVRGDHPAFHRAALRAPPHTGGTVLPRVCANTALWVNRPHEALRVARAREAEHGEHRRWTLYWRDYTQALHLLGRHREELRVVRRAQALAPGDLALVGLEVRALAALRRWRDIELILDARGDLPPTPWELREAALELSAHGSPAAGQALLRRALEWAVRQNPVTPATRVFIAETHYLLGELDEAEAALANFHDAPLAVLIDAHGVRAAIAARRGDVEEAVRVSQWLAAVQQPHLHGRHTFWRARIAALRGEPEEAVRLLRQAYQEGHLIWQHLHREPDFAGMRTVPAFRELMRPKG